MKIAVLSAALAVFATHALAAPAQTAHDHRCGGALSGDPGGLRRLPYRAGRKAFRGWRAAVHAVRQAGRTQHHPGSRYRHRRLERGRVPPRDEGGHRARRRAALAGDDLSGLCPHERRRCRGAVGLYADNRPGASRGEDQSAALSLQHPRHHAGVELDQLQTGAVQAGSRQIRGLEPRRLYRYRTGTLRRLSYAQIPTRRRPAEQGAIRRVAAGLVCARHHDPSHHGYRRLERRTTSSLICADRLERACRRDRADGGSGGELHLEDDRQRPCRHRGLSQ